jgi:hypothetical protein
MEKEKKGNGEGGKDRKMEGKGEKGRERKDGRGRRKERKKKPKFYSAFFFLIISPFSLFFLF